MVVAVASGDEKPQAILGALRAGSVDVLIVDEANARAVIGLALHPWIIAPDQLLAREFVPRFRGLQ